MKVFAVIFFAGNLYELVFRATPIHALLAQFVTAAGISIFIWELGKSDILYVPINKTFKTEFSALTKIGLSLTILGVAMRGFS